MLRLNNALLSMKPCMQPKHLQSTKLFALATTVNLLFVIVEAGYAWRAHSMSLLADAGHNVGDVVGLAVSGIAVWMLKKPRNDRYSYGFKRMTIIAALLNAVLLLLTTGAILIKSVYKLSHPLPIQADIVMLVAAAGILVHGGTALCFVHDHGDLNIKSNFLHLAWDAMLSIVIVAVGAVTGWTHWLWLDPGVAIVFALWLFYNVFGLLRQVLSLSLDAVPRGINPDHVKTYLQQLPLVTDVHHLHIWALSTQQVALTVHLVVPSGLLDQDTRRKVSYELAQKFNIQHATLQVEQHTQPFSCQTC